jgi:hypothetical protein
VTIANRLAQLGPCVISQYPLSAWSKADVNLEEIWKIVGPTAEKHLKNMELWKVFCACYFEDLVHGYEAAHGRLGEKS